MRGESTTFCSFVRLKIRSWSEYPRSCTPCTLAVAFQQLAFARTDSHDRQTFSHSTCLGRQRASKKKCHRDATPAAKKSHTNIHALSQHVLSVLRACLCTRVRVGVLPSHLPASFFRAPVDEPGYPPNDTRDCTRSQCAVRAIMPTGFVCLRRCFKQVAPGCGFRSRDVTLCHAHRRQDQLEQLKHSK